MREEEKKMRDREFRNERHLLRSRPKNFLLARVDGWVETPAYFALGYPFRGILLAYLLIYK